MRREGWLERGKGRAQEMPAQGEDGDNDTFC